MARYVVLNDVTVAGTGYAQPTRKLKRGQVVELSSSEVTAIGAGNLRSPAYRDQLGEGAAASNSD